MFQETAFAPSSVDATTAPEPGYDESRRQFINHAGRGLLAVGVAGAAHC